MKKDSSELICITLEEGRQRFISELKHEEDGVNTTIMKLFWGKNTQGYSYEFHPDLAFYQYDEWAIEHKLPPLQFITTKQFSEAKIQRYQLAPPNWNLPQTHYEFWRHLEICDNQFCRMKTKIGHIQQFYTNTQISEAESRRSELGKKLHTKSGYEASTDKSCTYADIVKQEEFNSLRGLYSAWQECKRYAKLNNLNLKQFGEALYKREIRLLELAELIVTNKEPYAFISEIVTLPEFITQIFSELELVPWQELHSQIQDNFIYELEEIGCIQNKKT